VALLTLLIADWKPYRKHHEAFTLAAGLAVAGVTLMRHFAQTDAERQRRITESFSKAVEQLAHKDIEVRLGGIYKAPVRLLPHLAQRNFRSFSVRSPWPRSMIACRLADLGGADFVPHQPAPSAEFKWRRDMISPR
jgi:hypothetical protein